MSVIVSILSDQLIPNVLFIKQMVKADDYHVFLTTDKMEDDHKSSILSDTLELRRNNFAILAIDPNRPTLILETLKRFKWPKADNYIVNITGGTKMMSQSAFLFFSQKENTEIFYWPIGSNCIEQLHPEIKEKEIFYSYQIDLKTYIRAHGYDYTCQNSLSFQFSKADTIFNKVIQLMSPERVPEIIQAKAKNYSSRDKGYYLGTWFEEWLYSILKAELNLSNNQIAFNLKLKNRQSVRKSESDNEIDVAFVYNNKLFIWECKVFYSRSATGKKISEAVYKISSVSQSLGLQATSLVAVLSPFGKSPNRRDFLTDITKLMRVKRVFSLEDMMSKKRFISEIKKIINYE